jgi:hypothetical protein
MSGWLISCAIDATSSPIVRTRVACARWLWVVRSAASASLRSAISARRAAFVSSSSAVRAATRRSSSARIRSATSAVRRVELVQAGQQGEDHERGDIGQVFRVDRERALGRDEVVVHGDRREQHREEPRCDPPEPARDHHGCDEQDQER